jgi:hypothetical protein
MPTQTHGASDVPFAEALAVREHEDLALSAVGNPWSGSTGRRVCVIIATCAETARICRWSRDMKWRRM